MIPNSSIEKNQNRDASPFPNKFLNLPSGRIHYVDEGAGETIVFVHGTPTWSFEWRHLIRAFSPTHRCVAPDHLGFGLSERPENFSYTPEAHAENLLLFVKHLDLKNITLVVHDFGGPIGLPLKFNNPDLVKRLVVINSWMWSFAGDRKMEKAARLAGSALGRFLYRRLNFSLRMLLPMGYGDRKKLTSAIHKQYLDRFKDLWSREFVLWALARSLLASSDFFSGLWNDRGQLQKIPVLIIWGLRDKAFPPVMLDRWAAAIPQARLIKLAKAGHWPHEEDPEAVEKAIRDFL